jgi:hypothetical protein
VTAPGWAIAVYSGRSKYACHAAFLKEQFQPIAVSSYGRRAGTPAEKAESVMGISPAPARVTRTPVEQYLRDIAPPSHRTLLEAAQAQAKQQVRQAIRGQNPEAAARQEALCAREPAAPAGAH